MNMQGSSIISRPANVLSLAAVGGAAGLLRLPTMIGAVAAYVSEEPDGGAPVSPSAAQQQYIHPQDLSFRYFGAPCW